ncbi:MAG: HD domain-containing protein [Firmicutes bacterium]|nr:HD domain-containing protein [Bacillota bacterium]
MDLDRIRNEARKQMSPARWSHTLGVVEDAVRLARLWEADPYKAELAALLHDLVRDWTPESILSIAEAAGIVSDPVERMYPDLLHGPVAAFLAATQWGVNDREVIDAIALHTLGAEKMTTLAKIIYLADLVEPGRDYPGVERLRELVEKDLDRAMLAGFDQTLRYCLERGKMLHPRTINARNALLCGADRL